MARTRRPAKFAVKTNLTKTQFAIVESRYAIPEAFTVHAAFEGSEPFTVVVDVKADVPRGTAVRAWAGRVSVEVDHEGGVDSTTLRNIPIRDIVAEGCMSSLMRAQITKTGEKFTTKLTPIKDRDRDEVIGVVKRLVGYDPQISPYPYPEVES